MHKYSTTFILEVSDEELISVFELAVSEKLPGIKLVFEGRTLNGLSYRASTNKLSDFILLGQVVSIIYFTAENKRNKQPSN